MKIDNKIVAGIAIIILFLGITGIGGFFLLNNDDGDNPFNAIDDAIGSSMENEELSDVPNELQEDLDACEAVIGDENTATLDINGIGSFTFNPQTEGILVIKDTSPTVAKTVTVDGEIITFDNNYYSTVSNAGTHLITAIPNDESSYKAFEAQVDLVAGNVNAGDSKTIIVYLEEIQDEGVFDGVDEGVVGDENVGDEGAIGGEVDLDEPTNDEPANEDPTNDEPEDTTPEAPTTRTLTVRIVDESGNGVDNVRVKIGTSIYKTTNSNGYTTSAEISTTNSYYINAYGNDDYETKTILLTKGTSDITKTIAVEKLSGIPSGWVEFKVKAISTVDYRYDGSDAVLENVGMTFRTDGAYIYDVDRGAKVSYANFMTDEQGYSPDNRFYVPETGQEIEIDASNHIIAYGIDRTLSSSEDKNRCVWNINYCPKPIAIQFKATWKSGTTSSGSDYKYWYVAYNDKQVGYNNYNIFHRANLYLGALFNGEDGNADLEYSTDGTNWHKITSLYDPLETYGEVTIDVPSSGTTNLYIRTNYDDASDNYNDIRLWTIGKTSTGYVDIDYKGLQ